MNCYVLTLFPDMVLSGLRQSVLYMAEERGLIRFHAVNIRDHTRNKHKKVDDYPYGGGPGMVMQAEPVYLAYESIKDQLSPGHRVIYLTPQGQVFSQQMAKRLSREEDLVLLCGHYEGIDERVLEAIVTDYVSIGDYVLTGGELPAMVLIDAVARLIPGVLHNDESNQKESFQDSLLEHPHYSRPEEWMGRKVPGVLLSGHHANIDSWRREQSVLRTKERRPDLYRQYLASRES